MTGVKVEVVSDEVLAKKLRGVGDNTGAVGLQFVGAAAPLWLRQEEGVHVLEKVESDRRRCHVEMLSSPLEEIRLDLAKLQRVPDLKKFAIRRQFMTSRGMWRDSILETKGNARFSSKLLADLLEKTILAAAREAL